MLLSIGLTTLVIVGSATSSITNQLHRDFKGLKGSVGDLKASVGDLKASVGDLKSSVIAISQGAVVAVLLVSLVVLAFKVGAARCSPSSTHSTWTHDHPLCIPCVM